MLLAALKKQFDISLTPHYLYSSTSVALFLIKFCLGMIALCETIMEILSDN